MKEKKEKKSLRDVDNLVVKRSTRFNELSKSLSTTQFGTNSISLQTTSSSDLPKSYYISNDGVELCTLLGKYERVSYQSEDTSATLYRSNLLYIGGGRYGGDYGGWFYFKNGYSSFSHPKYNFNYESGYLFLYLSPFESHKFICNKCYDDRNVIEKLEIIFGGFKEYNKSGCSTIASNQDPMFAVLIQNISQINALNRTGALQTDGSFLSTAIKNALDNQTIKSVIDNIRGYDNDTTPIISPIKNPIEWNGTIFDINFNSESYESYPSEYGGTSIYINLKDLVTSDKFVNGLMGSGIFTVNRLAGVNGYFTPTLNTLNSYKPKIISSSILNINANELSVFDDTTYVQIMKPPTSVSTGFYQPQFLNFTLLLTQPFYYTTGELFYTEKTIVLGFRVTF
jgi:hypothetical protein